MKWSLNLTGDISELCTMIQKNETDARNANEGKNFKINFLFSLVRASLLLMTNQSLSNIRGLGFHDNALAGMLGSFTRILVPLSDSSMFRTQLVSAVGPALASSIWRNVLAFTSIEDIIYEVQNVDSLLIASLPKTKTSEEKNNDHHEEHKAMTSSTELADNGNDAVQYNASSNNTSGDSNGENPKSHGKYFGRIVRVDVTSRNGQSAQKTTLKAGTSVEALVLSNCREWCYVAIKDPAEVSGDAAAHAWVPSSVIEITVSNEGGKGVHATTTVVGTVPTLQEVEDLYEVREN
jgi:hypothetical protein